MGVLFDVVVYLLAAFGLWTLVSIPFYLRKTSLKGYELDHVEDIDAKGDLKWEPRGAEPLKAIHLRRKGKMKTAIRKAMVRDVGENPVVVVESYWSDTGQMLTPSEREVVAEMVETYRDIQARKDEAKKLVKPVNQLAHKSV